MANYDGVAMMGSEGYLINEFIVKKQIIELMNGGSYENRIRFSTKIVEKIREAAGNDFLIIYRLSCMDLVDE